MMVSTLSRHILFLNIAVLAKVPGKVRLHHTFPLPIVFWSLSQELDATLGTVDISLERVGPPGKVVAGHNTEIPTSVVQT